MKTFYAMILSAAFLPAFSQVASYNFTGGSGADGSGNGNTGTFHGASAYGDSLLIGSNTTDYFSIPNSVLNGKTTFSMFLKIKFNAFNTTGASPTNHIISGDQNSTFGVFSLSYLKSGNRWQSRINDIPMDFADANIVTNHWYCVTLTKSATGVIKLYVDGVQNTNTYTNTTSPMVIDGLVVGQETDCFLGCFAANQAANAIIDDLKFYTTEIPSQTMSSNCAPPVTTSLQKVENTVFSIFPNPTSDKIMIRNLNSGSEIELLTVDGKLVESYMFSSAEQNTVSVGHLAAGMYYLKIVSGNRTEMHKIVKY